ncbi:hypothetical protein [Microbacterium sp. CJ88]
MTGPRHPSGGGSGTAEPGGADEVAAAHDALHTAPVETGSLDPRPDDRTR